MLDCLIQEGPRAACWIKDSVLAGVREKSFADADCKPIWRVIFAEIVAVSWIDETLVQFFKNVFGKFSEIVCKKEIYKAGHNSLGNSNCRAAAHPGEEILLKKV